MSLYQETRDERNILTGYIRTTDNANIPIANGNADYKDVLKWITDGNTPDPDPDILSKVKAAKISEYKTEGVRRIGLQVPEWDTYERVKFAASIWNMLDAASATTAQNNAKAIYLYVKDTAIPVVNAQTDIAGVQAIDVINDPGWPV